MSLRIPGVLQLHPPPLQPESAHARSGILQPPAGYTGSLKAKARISTSGKSKNCPNNRSPLTPHPGRRKARSIKRSSAVRESRVRRHCRSAGPQALPNRNQTAPVFLCWTSNPPARNLRLPDDYGKYQPWLNSISNAIALDESQEGLDMRRGELYSFDWDFETF